MFRTLLFFFCLSSPAMLGIGGDFVLRIDTVGYEDEKSDSDKKTARLLRRIEANVEPERKFRALCRIGLEEIEVVGTADRQSDAGLKITLKYRYAENSPETSASNHNGNNQFPVSGTSVQTSLMMTPGKPYTLGGFRLETTSTRAPTVLQSQTEVIATLVELEVNASHQP